MAASLTHHVAALAKQRAAALPEDASVNDLNELLRLLGRWRSQMLANTYMRRHGARIWSGPFKGMEYVSQATEGALVPRLLGTYEDELHPHLLALADAGLNCVIDVGCAEGYYAVGLARMMPETTVYAYDIDEKARVACTELAVKNGVSDRVIIGGEFAPDGFEAFAGRRALVMVDAEGAEVDILQPALSPSLAHMSVIVETHDVYRPGARATMIERFSPTHDITVVTQQPKTFDMPDWLKALPHLDQLLAVWEWRFQPTPWLVMRPKSA
jgi:SAM-dependent methyltransferase